MRATYTKFTISGTIRKIKVSEEIRNENHKKDLIISEKVGEIIDLKFID